MADREYTLPEIADDVRDILEAMQGLRREISADYVRKDVADAERRADRAEVATLRARMESNELKVQTNYRLALTSLVAPIVVGLVLWLLLRAGP